MAQSVIDSFVFKLGIETEELKKDLRSVNGMFGQMFAVAGIVAFVKQVTDLNTQIHYLSQNLNMAVSDISALSGAAEAAGGSVEGLQGTFKMLSMAQSELLLKGETGMMPYLAALGVSLIGASREARDLDGLLIDIGQALMERNQGNRQGAFNMGLMMGIDEGTLNLILRSRQEVEQLIKKQKEYYAITGKQAEESARFKAVLVELKQAFFNAGRDGVGVLTPYLEKFATWFVENQGVIIKFVTIVGAGLLAFGLATIPITAVAAAIAAVGTAAALAWDDYQHWVDGNESVLPWKELAEFLKYEVVPAFNAVGFAMSKMAYLGMAANDILMGIRLFDMDRIKRGWNAIELGYSQDEHDAMKGKDDLPPAQKNAAAKKDAMSFFMSKGWTKEQAAGIVANLKAESAMNPSAVGDGGRAYGLAQWHPDRQANFKKWAGKDIRESTAEEQMGFVNYELRYGKESKAGRRLQETKTAREAAEIFSKYYERPKDERGEMIKRGNMAEQIIRPSKLEPQKGKGEPLGNRTTSVENNIGQITITTNATDSRGVAQGLANSMDMLLTAQANRGMIS
jgi:hypothetical protein